jgi:hypothetical protein
VTDPRVLLVPQANLIPLTAALAAAKSLGDGARVRGLLQCMREPLPRAWELRDEEAQNQADGVWDPVLSEEIAEAESWDEHEIIGLGEELCESFEPFAPCAEDEEKLNACRSYTLQRIPPSLQRELDTFKDFRIKRLNRHRRGAAVQDSTYSNDKGSALRL